jgi:uncharacterized protein (DUF1697 family)
LRAINVRGHTMVAMQDLTRAFEVAGCTDVRSVIQSGNVLFKPPASTQAALERVRRSVQAHVGTELVLLFRTLRAIEHILLKEPFKEYERQRGLKLYIAFLDKPSPSAAAFPIRSAKERLHAIAQEGREVFIVSGRKPSGFYGFPNNFIEKELGVRATTRNWSTIKKIVALVRAGETISGSIKRR